MSKNLGQYFTSHPTLKEKVFAFILNNPSNILEPSVGQGDLVAFIQVKIPNITFDMYEIDTQLKLLDSVLLSLENKLIYGDFLNQIIPKTYKTIVGNPPFVRTKKGNLYIDFTEKCYNLLEENGELIFIVPSDFFKLTCASKLLNTMMQHGSFTHIFHPHNEKMFENASIDVIVFRYLKCCKSDVNKTVFYNDTLKYISNSNGLITFHDTERKNHKMFQDYFEVYVGLVSGKETIYKQEFGNIDVLNGENKIEKYIYIEKFPCDNEIINEHLLIHKNELLERKIRKFNEKNWFEWGAPRNISTIRENFGKDCIYVYNLTRKSNVAFVSKVQYFGGGLIMLIPKFPKKECDLNKIVHYINSTFKDNFMFSGRFKIGHRQICNSFIPDT